MVPSQPLHALDRLARRQDHSPLDPIHRHSPRRPFRFRHDSRPRRRWSQHLRRGHLGQRGQLPDQVAYSTSQVAASSRFRYLRLRRQARLRVQRRFGYSWWTVHPHCYGQEGRRGTRGRSTRPTSRRGVLGWLARLFLPAEEHRGRAGHRASGGGQAGRGGELEATRHALQRAEQG